MKKAFLEQDTVQVAEQLIGCCLVRRTEQGTIKVRITETEAYKGSEDPASHAYRSMTPRNRLMFGEAGFLYVYFIYGMHNCMNVVAHPPGGVGAVLLRGAQAVEGFELIRRNRPGVGDRLLLNGPAKLTSALSVDGGLNGYDLLQNPGGLLGLQQKERQFEVRKTPRIGIKAGTDLLWRFVMKG